MRRLIAALVLLAVAGVGVTGCSGTPQSPRATAPTTAAHGTTTPSSAPPPPPASAQTVLPFTGLEGTHDVAVDTAGNVYVADTHQFEDDRGFPDATTRVIKLPAGSNTQTVLPEFVHASLVSDVAGAVWVNDAGNEQLVKWAAGSEAQTVMPFTGINHPICVTVDTVGNVYVIDGGNHRVLKLSAEDS
jgi:hypothetical protein